MINVNFSPRPFPDPRPLRLLHDSRRPPLHQEEAASAQWLSQLCLRRGRGGCSVQEGFLPTTAATTTAPAAAAAAVPPGSGGSKVHTVLSQCRAWGSRWRIGAKNKKKYRGNTVIKNHFQRELWKLVDSHSGGSPHYRPPTLPPPQPPRLGGGGKLGGLTSQAAKEPKRQQQQQHQDDNSNRSGECEANHFVAGCRVCACELSSFSFPHLKAVVYIAA